MQQRIPLWGALLCFFDRRSRMSRASPLLKLSSRTRHSASTNPKGLVQLAEAYAGNMSETNVEA